MQREECRVKSLGRRGSSDKRPVTGSVNFFTPPFPSHADGGNPLGGFLGIYENRRPGRAGLWLAPTALGSEVGYNGPGNGMFDTSVSGIFCWTADTNGVGAPRREALPWPPVFHVQRQMREHLASKTMNDILSPNPPISSVILETGEEKRWNRC